MLGKLIKHEFAATSRIILPLYLVLAMMTVTSRILLQNLVFEGAIGVIKVLMMLAYAFSIIAVMVTTMIVIILRFYKNLMTDEGYLMFTLPVKPGELIQSKLLVSITWMLSSMLAVAASLCGVFLSPQLMPQISAVWVEMLAEMNQTFGSGMLFLVEFALIMLLSGMFTTLMIYTSIAIGQLLGSHKLLGAFGAYMLINILIQIVAIVLTLLAGWVLQTNLSDPRIIPQFIFPAVIAFMLSMTFVFYFTTRHILKNKLNLE